MAKFKLELDLGNAAFTDPCGDNEFHLYARNNEIARILKEVADSLQVADKYPNESLYDYNGNKIGSFKITR